MLRLILDGLSDGKSEEQIEADILKNQKSLNTEADTLVERVSNWKETKSALRLKASLESAQRCAICKARLVISDASDDHIKRRDDGGLSGTQNAQLTHRYCNHGFKEHFAQRGLPLPKIEPSKFG